MAEKACAYEVFGFIETLGYFKEVVSSCFGTTLKKSFMTEIQNIFSIFAIIGHTKGPFCFLPR